MQGIGWILPLAAATLMAGCGGNDGGSRGADRIGSMTVYDAGASAKDILSRESVDPDSIAYGEVLFVDDTVADTLDGRPVFRVSFETLEGEPSDICIWVWLSNAQPFSEEVTYAIDRCPDDGAEA